MFKKSNKTIVALIAVIALSSMFFVAQPAHASFWSDPEATMINIFVRLAQIAAFAIGYIAANVFTLGGFFIDLALELNEQVTKLPMVRTGWTIVLNITNLLFVLGIIWIAITTILRMQGYETKKMMFRLIVAAVMVNFSLVLSGLILDASNVVTQVFSDAISPPFGHENAKSFANQLAASLKPQTAIQIPEGTSPADVTKIIGGSGSISAQTNMVAAGLNTLFNILFGVAMTVMGAIVFLCIGTLLFIRFVYLAILMVLAPIVWLGWVFPSSPFGGYWNEWWNKFTQWTFFAPSATFFLYLAILTSTNGNEFITKATNASNGGLTGAGTAIKGMLTSSLGTIAQNLVVMGLFVAALLAAEKSGLVGSKAFMGMAKTTGGWVTSKAKGLAKQPLRTKLAQDMAGGLAKSNNAFARTLGTLVAKPVASARGEQKDEVKKYIEQWEKTPKELRNERNTLNMSRAEKVGLMVGNAKNGNFEGLDIELAKKMGYDREIAKYMPSAGADVKAAEENIKKAKNPEEKAHATKEYEISLAKQLNSAKPEEDKEINLGALLKGKDTNVSGEEWLKSDVRAARLRTIKENVKGDKLSRILKGKSDAERDEIISTLTGVTAATSKEERMKALAELKQMNPTMHKYIRGIGSPVLGTEEEDEEEELKTKEAKEKAEEEERTKKASAP